MTTTAYDQHFIASDIAFTDDKDQVHLDIPFRKVKRIGNIVFGMAGCLECMYDFSNMICEYLTGTVTELGIPETIVKREDRDFIVMVYTNGMCVKLTKRKHSGEIAEENVTNTSTVIGSGSQYVQGVIKDCPSAVVAVLEAIKHDKYTDGDVKYTSVRRDDVHNLEAHPMSNTLKMQITGLETELKAANEFLNADENQGKVFKASTEVYHVGTTDSLPKGTMMKLLKESLDQMRAQA
ncbi:hypothetical protein IS636_003521 [Vibrio cholerae]